MSESIHSEVATREFRVSVIIPVFNASRHLARAVESALEQPEVGEVVLVDDGSTDESPDLAESLTARYPGRVKCFSHGGRINRGPGESRNLGLRQASCPFIAFLDADDWYLPGCFAFDREAFAKDPTLGMVRHSLGNGWDPDDETQRWFVEYTGEERARARFHSRVDGVVPKNYFSSLYPMGNVGSGVAGVLTVRKALTDAVGGFPLRDWAEDVTFHLKLAAVGRVAFADMDQPMAMRRIHADNLSRTKSKAIRERIDLIGTALLDVAEFARVRRLPWRTQAALHRGWLRFAHQYTHYRSFALIAMHPMMLLYPPVAWGYLKFYLDMLRRLAVQAWKRFRTRRQG